MEETPTPPDTGMKTAGNPAANSDMKMAGSPGNILIGTDNCGAYKDALGNYKERTVSTICWVAIVIVVVMSLSTASAGYKLIQGAGVLEAMMKVYSSTGVNTDVSALSNFVWYAGVAFILAAILASIIIYYHCTRCNGGVAFFKLMGLMILCYAIVKFMWNRAVDEFIDDNSFTDDEKDVLTPLLKAQI